MNDHKIRVALADDQPLVREGFRYVINAQHDMTVSCEAGDGDEITSLAKQTKPDVILMDVQMPSCSGIEATKQIMSAYPDTKIVILTTFDTEEYVFEGIRAGAVGYLLKDTLPEELIDAIRAAARGEAIFRTATAARIISETFRTKQQYQPQDGDLLEPFTKRELEVLQQMAYGLRNEDIADKLFVSESTVKTHVHRILQKCSAQDRTQAVVFAIRNGIVE
ncbi:MULTISPECIES: response regulator transcription factor [Bacillus]|uniref:Response regulator transcription factor n=1 Tax=Bacillus glycinifermentans TaxID=1664069 RepID=A0AAJ3Z124_9BACI|nr:MULTISPECIES: response regulator transcription factor [Bacillus]KKB73467.1 LuxR family transcriptional regulator [Bacillus sp. TH008]MBU8785610.1 response regulator transcription factor [Bacillus glycinifermentans]MDU0073601.1 response regulator transcription factor [Bacillus sp. IG6]MED8021489.1 response regulator transcription factor [Bacillus glycinifermentans]NUJ15930.1 response regulator transcription factor [Bacillus glycinifermentans]